MRRPHGWAALFAGLFASTASAAAPPEGPVDVLSFEVRMRPDLTAGAIQGQTTVRFRSRAAALTEVAFSPNALEIEGASAGGRPATVVRRPDALVIVLPRPLARGQTGEVTVRYAGKPARGLILKPAYAYAGYFACDWMICSQDAPGDKATFSLTLTVPAGAVTQGPGRLVSRQAIGDGLERQVWREAWPYSSYLFGFATGDFQRRSLRHGRAELVFLSPAASPERLGELFAPTGEMLDFFEAKAGVRLPHDRYVQLHVPGAEAQEAANYSILGDDVLAPRLTTPQEDWAIAHELAHQWWGNLVTCRDWSQFWLNEGITVFMVAAWKEHRWGRPAYDREMDLLRRRLQASGLDVPLTFAGPYASLAARRAITYSKGALFMDRLRREMGDEAFWRALKAYTRAHAGGVVDSRDFQRAFQRATRRDLAPLFDEWVYGG